MTPQEINKLEINALALREIANMVLLQVRAAKTKAATAQTIKKRKTDAERVADLKARILTGKIKPDTIKKTK